MSDAGATEKATPAALDFFISYADSDQLWSEWVAWQLEDVGYRVLIQAWDRIVGSNWLAAMQQGVTEARRTIALLSPAYLQSVWVQAEWQAVYPGAFGYAGRLVPIRVAECNPEGLLGAIVSFDLFGLPEETAKARLREQLAILDSGRAKPTVAPDFPGTSPGSEPDSASRRFPGSARPLAHGSWDGMVQEDAVTFEGAAPERLDAIPVLDAYLHWMVDTHRMTMATIAGRKEIRHIHVPLTETPWTGTVVEDDANHHARRSDAAYLRSPRVGGGSADDWGEAARVARRPFPTSMSPLVHVDRLDLSGRERLPAHGLLDNTWRFILLGDPGSGKTTLARRLALRNAESPSLTDPCWRLPVLCRATKLIGALADADAAGDSATMRALAALAVNAGWDSAPINPLSGDRIGETALSGLVSRATEQGRLLLMVDGLDEVSTGDERARLVSTLNLAINRDGLRTGVPGTTAGNQLVVTSRVVGYYANPMSELVHQLILQPMDTESALSTGCFWLKHFALATGRGPVQAAAMESQFRRVVEAVDTAPLAANPALLVSLLSAVLSGDLDGHRFRKTPIVRSDLYRFMVEDALDRARRRLPHASRDQLLEVQAAVAYEMHRSFHSGLLAPTDMVTCVRAALESLKNPLDLSVEEVVDYIRNLGLMTDRGPEQLGFLHRTLEEYLAGRHLVAGGGAEGRIRTHLSDPRWVEPTRLGLGHLGRADRSRFTPMLSGLLSGPGGEYAARLLTSSIAELGAVRAHHVEAAVMALLAADRSQTVGSGQPSRTAEAVAPLLSSDHAVERGQRPADIVRKTLAVALRAESMWDVAVAARTVEALGLFDRDVAEALFVAQERDAAEYGWSTVRALQRLVAPPEAPPAGDPAAVRRVWAGLTDSERLRLRDVQFVASRRPTTAAIDGLVLPRALTPFRVALDSRLVGLIEAGPIGLLRVVLCLYGVVPFLDTERWTAEKARLKAELVVNDTSPAERHSAAVRLDTVIAKALGKKAGERLLGPEAITVDSPLTGRLLRWIEGGASAGEMARQLRLLADDVRADDRVRGDALVAWFALGTPDAWRDGKAVLEQIDESVRRRLAWRMDRATFVLADAAARISVGSVVTAFDALTAKAVETPSAAADRRAATEKESVFASDVSKAKTDSFRRAVAMSLGDVSGTGPIVAGGWEWDSHLQVALVGAIYGREVDDKVYSVVVVLDTVGARIARRGPLVIAQILATAHLFADEFGDESQDWYLDRHAPTAGSPFPEALTALSGLSPRMTFARCWLIDRLASQLATGGLGVEAVCLALAGVGDDPAAVERTVERLKVVNRAHSSATAEAWLAVDLNDPVMPTRLLDLADGIADRYARARALVRVAALRGSLLDSATVLELALGITRPEDRVRFIELAASLAVCDWSPGLAAAAASSATAIEDPADRALAVTRLLDRGGTPEYLQWLRGQAHAAAALSEDYGPDDEQAEVEDAPFLGSSQALLVYDRTWRNPEASRSGLDAWAILSAATVCTEVLTALRTAGPAALWRSLADPGRRFEAAQALRRQGQDRLLALGPEALEAIDLLLRDENHDLAADLLSVVRPRRGQVPPASWRAVENRRFADRATLLTLESGRFDAPAVRTLPRLLSDSDDLVRLRSAVATSFTSRGGPTSPRFTATGLGPAGLADLVRLLGEVVDDQPWLAADVRWALDDVIHNSAPVLVKTLATLTEQSQRNRLLRSVIRITPNTLAALPGLLADLPEADQLALVYSLQCIARNPRRCGVTDSAVGALGNSLRSFVPEAYGPLRAEILCVLGLVGATGTARQAHRDFLASLVREGTQPGTEVSPAVAAGACHGLGFLLEGAERAAHPDELRLLRTVARTAEVDDGVAEAAVTALARIGDWEWLQEAVAARDIVPPTVLWGLVGELDAFVVGREDQIRIRRICDFVLRPPGFSGADAADITDRLTDALLDRASELMQAPIATRSGTYRPTDVAWEVSAVLSVIAGLAHTHPAAVRPAVDRDYPDFRHNLVREFAAGSWVSDQSAARLLVVLGDADRETVGAILDTAQGADVVRHDLLQDLRLFEPVDPAGVALLVDAVADPNLKRCYLAARILAALVRYEVLDGTDHIAALAAIRGSLDRHDITEPLRLESFGVVAKFGTYGEAIRRLLTGLIADDKPATASKSDRTVLIQLPDAEGGLRLAVPDLAGPAIEVLEYQTSYFRDTEEREIPADRLVALRQVLSASWSAGIPVTAVLEYGVAEGPRASG